MSAAEEPVYLVIPAAGIGSRMQADKPKQYLPLLGKTVIEQTLAAFAVLPELAAVIVAVSPDDPFRHDLQQRLSQQLAVPLILCSGGTERADTVLLALQALRDGLSETASPCNPWVMVHDAARPCVQTDQLKALLAIRSDYSVAGGILATAVADTLKRADPSGTVIAGTQSREDLWQAQTPQLFRLEPLIEALNRAVADGVAITDEASAMEHCGHTVRLVEGSTSNIKITRPADLVMAEAILQRLNRGTAS